MQHTVLLSQFCPSVCLIVCLSVCPSDACIVRKLNNALRIFWYHTKRNHSSFLTPTVVGGRCPLPSEICAQSDPPPFEKRRLRPISAHNVWTVRDSEKSSITTNIKSTTGFPTSHRWSSYVTLKCPKGWLKERVFRFLSNSQRLIVSSAVNLVRRAVLSTYDGRPHCLPHRRRLSSRSVFSS